MGHGIAEPAATDATAIVAGFLHLGLRQASARLSQV